MSENLILNIDDVTLDNFGMTFQRRWHQYIGHLLRLTIIDITTIYELLQIKWIKSQMFWE
jgi:ribosomal 50S subunit-associated protein YjgA (DUF615 family)